MVLADATLIAVADVDDVISTEPLEYLADVLFVLAPKN